MPCERWCPQHVVLALALAGSACSPGPERPAATADDSSAAAFVRGYLELARRGAYDTAMSLYDGDWRPLARAWFEGGDSLSAGGYLGEACRSGLLFCQLTPRSVVEILSRPPDTIIVVLQLNDANGQRFEPPACCGEEGGPDTLFPFQIRRTPGGFRSLSLPVYRP